MSLKSDGASTGAAAEAQIVVPASVANLGGGFDTLGVAVELYLRARVVEVTEDGGGRLRVVSSEPPVEGDNAVERAYANAVAHTGRRAPSIAVEVSSEIPLAAGLGSSAAATVAGLRLFEQMTGPVDDGRLLRLATDAEGHADNAAPALFGGLNSVVVDDAGAAVALRWPWPDDLVLVVATPAGGLPTSKARAALPPNVARADAIFNLQRVLALVHALQHGDYGRLRQAVGDRLHQPARSALVPLLGPALAVEDQDVLGAFLSGAGPSVALLARREAGRRVARVLEGVCVEAGVTATVRTLAIDQQASGPRAMDRGTRDAMADAVTSAHGSVR